MELKESRTMEELHQTREQLAKEWEGKTEEEIKRNVRKTDKSIKSVGLKVVGAL